MNASDLTAGTSTPRRLTIHVGLSKACSMAQQAYLMRNATRIASELLVLNQRVDMPCFGRAVIAYSHTPSIQTGRELRRSFAELLAALPENGLPVLLTLQELTAVIPGNVQGTALFRRLPQIVRLLMDQAAGFDTGFVLSAKGQPNRQESDGGTLRQCGTTGDGMPGGSDLALRLSEGIGASRVAVLHPAVKTDLRHPGRPLLRLAGLSRACLYQLDPVDHAAMTRMTPNAPKPLRQLGVARLNPHARHKVAHLVARCQPLFNADFRPQGNLS